jgi:hypothetical protein
MTMTMAMTMTMMAMATVPLLVPGDPGDGQVDAIQA